MEEQEETFWGPHAAEYEIKLGTVLQTVVEIWNNKEFDSLWKKSEPLNWWLQIRKQVQEPLLIIIQKLYIPLQVFNPAIQPFCIKLQEYEIAKTRFLSLFL